MILNIRSSSRQVLALLLAFSFGLLAARSQERPPTGKSIDIDKALQGKVEQDRAGSYYHYSLAKWFEDKGDLSRALSEMQKAANLNESSSPVRVELAKILAQAGRPNEALEEAEEATRLDPKDPDPYWLRATIYSRGSGGVSSKDPLAMKETLQKAVRELEKMQQVAPDDARAYYALGNAYFELGEPEKAIQSYEKLQTLVPNTDAGYLSIARYYEKTGDYEKAVEYLSKAVDGQQDSVESMMLLATLYSKLKKDKEAIPLYKKLLQLTGDNLSVKRQLGASLVDTGEFDEAVAILEAVVEADPQDKDSLVLLGRAQLGARQTTKAIESFKSALDANPKSLEAEFYLGTAYEQSGNSAEAVKVFARLLEQTRSLSGEYSEEQKANRAVFQQHLASAYQDLGEHEKAISIYEEMVKGETAPNPRLVFLLINAYRVNRQLEKALILGKQHFDKNSSETPIALVYARTLADAGKTNQGAEILQKLIQADPSNLDLYVNLSQIYLQAKRYTDAEKILRRAQTLESLKEPDGERLKFQLAAVYERQKEFDRAESLFMEVIKSNPDNASALNYIGYMLADRGVRLEEAVEYVEKALALEPNNGAYLDSLGWAFFKLNDIPQAEKYLLKAVSIVKNDPTIHEHLGDLYYKTGDYDKAQEFWTKSVSNATEPDEIEKVQVKIEKLKETLRKQKRR
jgi:tetratricopeptide (TPR) repeat protein